MTEILLISHAEDATTRAVADQLNGQALWFDLADFPLKLGLSARYGTTRTSQLVGDDTTMNLQDVRAIYYRRPTQFRLPAATPPADRQFLRSEARAGIGGILSSLECRWINHPARCAEASLKSAQLTRAQDVGLAVPRTLITNDAAEAACFAEETAGQLVYKPLGPLGIYDEHGVPSVLFTSVVDQIDPEDPAIGLTTHLFQERVPKSHELRVVVVGNRCFAMAIHAHSETAAIDWRRDINSVTYAATDILDSLKKQMISYLQGFGLVFGVFDLIVTPEGQHIFLECNANGQWFFVEEATGMPIAAAIAEELRGTAP